MPNLEICLTILRFVFFRPRDPPTNNPPGVILIHKHDDSAGLRLAEQPRYDGVELLWLAHLPLDGFGHRHAHAGLFRRCDETGNALRV